jgi:hypothetical protein
MAYSILPENIETKFKRVDQCNSQELEKFGKNVFYQEDLDIVRRQSTDSSVDNNTNHIGFCFDFATLKQADGTEVTCLAAFSVTSNMDNDGSWTARLSSAGNYIALSCPRYVKEKEYIEIK